METPYDQSKFPRLTTSGFFDGAGPILEGLNWNDEKLEQLEEYPDRLIHLILSHDQELLDAYGGEASHPPNLLLAWLLQDSDDGSGLNMDYFGSDSAPQESFDEMTDMLPPAEEVHTTPGAAEDGNDGAYSDAEGGDGNNDGATDADWFEDLKRRREADPKGPPIDHVAENAKPMNKLQMLKDADYKCWAYGLPRHFYDVRLTPGRITKLAGIHGVHIEQIMQYAVMGKSKHPFKRPADYTGLRFINGDVFHLGLIRAEARFQTADNRVLLIENPPENGVGSADELDRAPHPHLVTLINQVWKPGNKKKPDDDDAGKGQIELGAVITYMMEHPDLVLAHTGQSKERCAMMVNDFFQNDGRPLLKHLLVQSIMQDLFMKTLAASPKPYIAVGMKFEPKSKIWDQYATLAMKWLMESPDECKLLRPDLMESTTQAQKKRKKGKGSTSGTGGSTPSATPGNTPSAGGTGNPSQGAQGPHSSAQTSGGTLREPRNFMESTATAHPSSSTGGKGRTNSGGRVRFQTRRRGGGGARGGHRQDGSTSRQ